jgi:hypothetical protein
MLNSAIGPTRQFRVAQYRLSGSIHALILALGSVKCSGRCLSTKDLCLQRQSISKTAISSLASLASWPRRERRVRRILGQDEASFESRFTFLRKDVRSKTLFVFGKTDLSSVKIASKTRGSYWKITQRCAWDEINKYILVKYQVRMRNKHRNFTYRQVD